MTKMVLAVAGLCLIAVRADAGGFASNDDFIVHVAADGEQVADRTLAQGIARRATEYRKRIAEEWLGQELPPSVGRTCLSVMLTDDQDQGLTWPKNEVTGEYNNVHLSTTRDGALGGTLGHEIAHVVLATRYPFPGDLPPWVVEGIASRYDAEPRRATRRQIIAWYARTGNWPKLGDVLRAEVIPPNDKAAYAVAASLTEFLVERAGKRKFLEFAKDGRSNGWDAALSSHYGIHDQDELQTLWQNSAARAGETDMARNPLQSRVSLNARR